MYSKLLICLLDLLIFNILIIGPHSPRPSRAPRRGCVETRERAARRQPKRHPGKLRPATSGGPPGSAARASSLLPRVLAARASGHKTLQPSRPRLCPLRPTGGREAPPTSKLPRLPRFDSCKLNPAWGLPAQKGQERRVKEDLETRPPAERLAEINIQRAGPRSPGGAR